MPSTLDKIRITLPWLPRYVWQRCTRRLPEQYPVHLIVGVADHFEPWDRHGPRGTAADQRKQDRRVKKWCQDFAAAVQDWPDDDGRPFRHTYFYPAEQYDGVLIDRLAEHCHSGWGEIEIHLHHGIDKPDTGERTLQALMQFRDALASHGCLSRENGLGSPRYGFVHGNWALANSAQGRFCGVDEEMQILAATGCYADFTLPAPSKAQVNKINALYECALPLNRRAPHRRGIDLQSGRTPTIFPLIIQGPLLLDSKARKLAQIFPRIESGELSANNPPTLRRLELWRKANVTVRGLRDWVFIKLHCHGMAPRDREAMVGEQLRSFLKSLTECVGRSTEFRLHFVTMREMVNIILAACDGRRGNPNEYRDYRFQLAGRISRPFMAGESAEIRDKMLAINKPAPFQNIRQSNSHVSDFRSIDS